jgi:peptidoglycan/LPS O-acetylase OafA/YrhL
MKTESLQKTMRVSELDLLRFVAAMMVVIFHYAFRGYAANNYSPIAYSEISGWAQYGYLGVQLFFMISGFVILMTASSGGLRKFIVSRVTRLYPAFWFCCTLTFVAVLLFGAPRFTASLKQYLVNMTMFAEFLSIPAIDGVYWTLTVELKFYAMIAIVLAAGRLKNIQIVLIAWLIATLVLDVFPSWRLSQAIIAAQAQFFVAGAMCFLIYSNGATLTRIAVLVACWVISIQRELAGLSVFAEHYHSQLNPIVVALLITIFYGVMTSIAFRVTGFFARRNWVAVGALTYPLYLVHQNIGYIVFNAANGIVNRYVLLAATIVAMLGLAFLVHVLVERKAAKILKKVLEKAFYPGGKGTDVIAKRI